MRVLLPALLLLCLPACGPLRQAQPPASPPALELGVNIHLNRGPLVARLRDLGARWVRLDLVWAGMEPRRGEWNFEPFDLAIAQARSQGFSVYANLLYAPAWASANGRSNGVPGPGAWRAFVRTVARRYRGQVQVYGIWNEPNLEDYWAGSAAQYTEVLLKPAFRIIRREDPVARVAGPELAHLYSATIPAPLFFEELQRLGGADCLDIVAHHVYGGDDFKAKLLGFRFAGVLYRKGLRQMLGQSGLWGKELWITEFGVDAAQGGEEAQARDLVERARILSRLGWVSTAMVYELIDDPAHAQRWGLLRADGSPRPAFEGLRAWKAGLAP